MRPPIYIGPVQGVEQHKAERPGCHWTPAGPGLEEGPLHPGVRFVHPRLSMVRPPSGAVMACGLTLLANQPLPPSGHRFAPEGVEAYPQAGTPVLPRTDWDADVPAELAAGASTGHRRQAQRTCDGLRQLWKRNSEGKACKRQRRIGDTLLARCAVAVTVCQAEGQRMVSPSMNCSR